MGTYVSKWRDLFFKSICLLVYSFQVLYMGYDNHLILLCLGFSNSLTMVLWG